MLKAAIVYEAKGNPVIFNYLNSTGFNNAIPRRKARAQAVNQIMNQPTTAPVFELPQNSIEIKATWRRVVSQFQISRVGPRARRSMCYA